METAQTRDTTTQYCNGLKTKKGMIELINHRKPWTVEEETRFAEFMLSSISKGLKVKEAIAAANKEFNRKNCSDRWNCYGLINLYAEELKEAKLKGKNR